MLHATFYVVFIYPSHDVFLEIIYYILSLIIFENSIFYSF